jgi:hypothetical protein
MPPLHENLIADVHSHNCLWPQELATLKPEVSAGLRYTFYWKGKVELKEVDLAYIFPNRCACRLVGAQFPDRLLSLEDDRQFQIGLA